MKYKINHSNQYDLFVVVTKGEMSGAGFVAMGQELLNHPEWAKDKNVIFDHRSLAFDSISPADLDEIRSFHQKNETKIGSGKSAIVLSPGFASRWNNMWGIGEKIQTDNKVQIFESYKEAEDWLLKQD